MKLHPISTASRVIEDTMKGVGTKEYHLATAILCYQSLLDEICPVYEKEYGKTLEERLKGELRGDFEKLVVRMIE